MSIRNTVVPLGKEEKARRNMTRITKARAQGTIGRKKRG